MGEVVYGIDFRERREREFREKQDKVIKALCEILEQADTSPSEYCAPESDPA